ncbi:MAG: Holliday junction resolvase RuvX [Proteobacteria bacterium]|nr:Holliday junction resolvase RuvX [Pseudomonadota bacterium]
MNHPPKLPQGYVLGIDFGLKNIGVAVSQTITGHANNLCTVQAKNGDPIDWRELKQLVAEYQPITIVVGLPLNMDDSESAMAKRARKFADTLAHRTDSNVVMSDERLSSWSANHIDSSVKGADLHQASACRIVETWLREQRQDQ